MNAPWRPGSAGRPFGPHELEGADEGPFDQRDLAEALGGARDLESASAEAHPLAVSASAELVDRVMAAIATEPLPAPARSAGRAVRSGRFGAGVAAILDAWHVARSGGRPVALRVQAFSLVLVVVVALGSLGGLVAVGTLNLLSPHPTESPIPVASPTPEPSPSPSPTPTPTSSPSPSPAPSPSVTPSDTTHPADSTVPTATHRSGDSGGGTGARPTPTRTAPPTARPTDTPGPTSTEDHGGGGGETPRPTDASGGGSGGGGGSGDGGSGSGSGGATSTPGG